MKRRSYFCAPFVEKSFNVKKVALVTFSENFYYIKNLFRNHRQFQLGLFSNNCSLSARPASPVRPVLQHLHQEDERLLLHLLLPTYYRYDNDHDYVLRNPKIILIIYRVSPKKQGFVFRAHSILPTRKVFSASLFFWGHLVYKYIFHAVSREKS